MFKYVCKRIGLFFVSLFIIMTMLFVLIRMLPNPVVAVTGGYARQLEDMRRAWGYYDPIIVQYGIFLKNLFTGFNWGFCTTVGTFLQPVEEYLASKIPATLYVNVLSLIFSVPLGILFGVIAAVFKNKWQDQVINVFMGSMFAMFFCFIFFGWISTSSTVRAQFYRFKGQEYVVASRTLGAKDSRLIFKHILPNASGFIITACVLSIPYTIFSEATYSYLGIVNLNSKTTTSLGSMLQNGQATLSTYPHCVFFPAVFLALLLICFNIFGNGLRDAFNPSLRGAED
ncbi:MAG: ABC transporter permease subunit [Candidatus Ventricola sp.]|nr:ABC transporter permease subunit [Candidatus Ventricola sp.]